MTAYTQTNTKTGPIVLTSAEDLTGKEGRLVQIVNSSNVAEFALPDAVSDLALFVLTEGGDADGDNCEAIPLSPDGQVRLLLKSTCVPGDVLVLAAIAGGDDGMVRKLPTAGGTYRGIAIAEEVGVDGQLVLARPANIGNITVT
jgi:hypothetical protein